jgi:nucleotide-binding universal stress UspA family protein
VDLSVTIPGQYEKLLEQIRVQEYLLAQERKSELPFQDALADWYDNVYIPVAETIRDRGLLRWFPGRTITDLYIWISTNRAALENELGWEIQSDAAATDLILDGSIRSRPGSWREAHTVPRYTDRLFLDILVPLSGAVESWDALEQALVIAQREGSRVHGLHVVDAGEGGPETQAGAIQSRFDETCLQAQVEGNLVIETGEITSKICERATAADLIVLKLLHPPVGGLSSWRSPFYGTLLESSRPVLSVPTAATPLARALLAYDGSLRAKEALFVATYLAEVWGTELIVFTAADGGKSAGGIQDFVRRYLDIHEVEADYVISERGTQEGLSWTIAERSVDLVLMGSHSKPRLQQVLLGSALNYMLQEASVPIFICR